MMVQRKLPCCIDVSVEKDTAFYFTAAGTNCRYIYTLAFRKHPVNDWLIHNKVKNKQEQ